MLKKLLKSFTPTAGDDDETTRIAGMLNRIVLGAWALPLVIAIAAILRPEFRTVLMIQTELLLIFLLAIISVIAFRGNTRLASLMLISLLVILASYISYTAAGEPRPALVYYVWIIMVGGLLLGGRATIIIAVLFSIAQIVITQLASMGVIRPVLASQTPTSGTILIMVGYFLAAFTFRLATSSIQTTLLQVRNSERKLLQSNQKLEEATQSLEMRVQERTAALDKRARQLEAISNVARSIASLQNMDELLTAVARLVSERFGYYHVGIFLTDEKSEYAILQATNSTGGQNMLDRQHKLKLDTNSIVGFVTSRGEPRIALDVGSDSVFFNNPDLPDTHSEIALPLRVGGRTIGALDAQSTEPNAFSQEDIAILATLADQVAIAIENSRLFSESRKALFESQATIERYIKQEWSSFARQAKQTGFVYDGRHVQPLDDKTQREKAKAIQTGRLSLEKTSSAIAIPIKLRGQTIGMLDVKPKKGTREWTQDEITLLETAAERAALAIENARLVESAQRRASRERTIGEISTKIGSVTDLETIMQTAVEELGRKIGGATEVVLEIVTENDNGKQA